VVLDANVLYPFTLRDTLLRAAAAAYYQAYWSADILDEVFRNLIASAGVSVEQAQRLRDAMQAAFPEATVVDYAHLVPVMTNHPKDRHVVAAAVRIGAQLVVTNNLRDFGSLPEGIDARSPDEFLCDLFHLAPVRMIELLRRQAAALRRPPITFEHLGDVLGRMAPRFAQLIAQGD
jgi:predicted nucleic acid-binding protein